MHLLPGVATLRHSKLVPLVGTEQPVQYAGPPDIQRDSPQHSNVWPSILKETVLWNGNTTVTLPIDWALHRVCSKDLSLDHSLLWPAHLDYSVTKCQDWSRLVVPGGQLLLVEDQSLYKTFNFYSVEHLCMSVCLFYPRLSVGILVCIKFMFV